ncbi:MAG: hypothetical protein P8Z37_14350 [Acidobacteriota bacterium]
MGNSLHAHLLKPLSIGNLTETNAEKNPASGPGNATHMFRLNGKDHLEGMHLNLVWGIHTEVGTWHGDMDPHVHPSPECLLFVGLDTASARYLGAEISICLGEEQETYTFNEPTLVVLPPGIPHGPITTDRMFSPRGFGCWSVSLHSEPDITWMGTGVSALTGQQQKAAPEGMHFADADTLLETAPIPATGKYAHLVKSLKPFILVERGTVLPERAARIQSKQQETSRRPEEKPGPGSADHMVWLTGKDLEGLNATIAWGLCSQPGISRRGVGAHVHPVDEVLVYLGMDPRNVHSLGAEIEVDLGEEHERYLVNEPAAIVCPAGMPHMPSVTRWVDRPYAFFAVCLSGEHEAEAFD